MNHELMFNFIGTYPNISDLFSFNFMDAKNNSAAFRVIDEEIKRKDILGDETIIYTFAIAEYKNYSTNPQENLESLGEVDKFIDWIHEQDRIKNYPAFDGIVEEMTAARTRSGIVDVDYNNRLAQYSFTVKVTYEKRGQ